jgi:hypothetical protein
LTRGKKSKEKCKQKAKDTDVRNQREKKETRYPPVLHCSVSNPVSHEEERRREGIVITPKV